MPTPDDGAVERITLEPFVADQQQIMFLGRRVGYCGTKPDMPVNFLTEKKRQLILNLQEKLEVVRFVEEQMGSIKETPQIRRLFEQERIERLFDDEELPLDHQTDPGGEGPDG